MALEEIIDPTAYPAIWLVVAVVLAAVTIVWLSLIPYLTKRRVLARHANVVDDHRQFMADRSPTMREVYRDRITELAQQRDTGAISDRDLHQQLSTILREYTRIRLGINADTMVLSDLQRHPATGPVATVIARCYDPAFSREGTAHHDDGQEDPTSITVHDALNVVERI